MWSLLAVYGCIASYEYLCARSIHQVVTVIQLLSLYLWRVGYISYTIASAANIWMLIETVIPLYAFQLACVHLWCLRWRCNHKYNNPYFQDLCSMKMNLWYQIERREDCSILDCVPVKHARPRADALCPFELVSNTWYWFSDWRCLGAWFSETPQWTLLRCCLGEDGWLVTGRQCFPMVLPYLYGKKLLPCNCFEHIKVDAIFRERRHVRATRQNTIITQVFLESRNVKHFAPVYDATSIYKS